MISNSQVVKKVAISNVCILRHELKIEDSLVEVIKSRKFDVDVVRWKNIGRISVMTPDWTPETKEKQKKKLVSNHFLKQGRFFDL